MAVEYAARQCVAQIAARRIRLRQFTFPHLGLGAYAGRVFSDSDDTPASQPTTVLSYQAWQGEYAADPSIVGSTIFIQARPFTVIGIAPAGFFGDRVSDSPPDFWMPLQMEPYVRGPSAILHHQESNWLYPLGRVRAGTNIGALQAKLTAALRQWIYTRPLLTANGGASIIPEQHVTINARRRRHPELATGNGQGSQNADDPLLRRVAHRLR